MTINLATATMTDLVQFVNALQDKITVLEEQITASPSPSLSITPVNGLTLLATVTETSNTQIRFTARNADEQTGDLFQNDFSVYFIVFTRLIPSVAGSHFYVQYSHDGIAWITTNYYRNYAFYGTNSSSGASGSSSDPGWIIADTTKTTTGCAGHGYLFNPLDTTYPKFMFSEMMFQNNTDSAYYRTKCGVTQTNNTAFITCRVIPSSGLITGSVSVYGVNQ